MKKLFYGDNLQINGNIFQTGFRRVGWAKRSVPTIDERVGTLRDACPELGRRAHPTDPVAHDARPGRQPAG